MLPHVQKDPAQFAMPKCPKAHYEMTIGKRNSQLGILQCLKTHYTVTIGNPNSQLGIDKCSETHYEVTIGNFNSQLGIPKCSETHHEVTIGNFNSQLGTHKCSNTRYEMPIGNLTPSGELNLYKRNGVGRPPSDRLPGCICWQISIVGAKASEWGDTPSPVRCKFGNRACANTSSPVGNTPCAVPVFFVTRELQLCPSCLSLLSSLWCQNSPQGCSDRFSHFLAQLGIACAAMSAMEFPAVHFCVHR